MKIEGWILDAYPGTVGEMIIWIKQANGETLRLKDKWNNAIYVSADNKSSLENLSKNFSAQYVHFIRRSLQH